MGVCFPPAARSCDVFINPGSDSNNPIEALTQVNYGSGDFDTFSLDTKTGRMKGYQYNVGTSGLAMKGVLNWNSNGTLQQLAITDPFNSGDAQTCTYGYDDIARVNSVGCGSVWAQTFTYDPFGNISKSGSISFAPVYTAANNQFQAGWGGSSYDANGDLLTDPVYMTPSNRFTWDFYGNLASANGKSITNDALGRMVELNGATQFVYGPDGQQPIAVMQGQTLSSAYVPLPSGAFAIYGSAGLAQYNHADWLGSARLITTPSQTVNTDMAYAPFGEGYAGSGWVQFTSAGNDWTIQSTVGRAIDDFLYRRYSPVQGRWISPDPAGMAAVDPSNPQTWNRYAYVMNNPTGYVDPYGLYCAVHYDQYDIFNDNCGAGGPGMAQFFWQVFSSGVGGYGGSGQQDVAHYDYNYGGEGVVAGNADIGYSASLSFSATLAGVTLADPIPNFNYALGIGWLGGYGSAGGGGWWRTFARTFASGVLHGVRQPGQSFTQCLLQNANETTGGEFGNLTTAAAALVPVTAAVSTGLAEKVATGVAIEVGSQIGSAVGNLETGIKVGSAIYLGIHNGALAVGYGGAVLGGAALGTAIGSAINCR